MTDANRRNALITGASRGLGRALAEALADAGWGVVINARTESELYDAAREIERAAPLEVVAGDINDADTRGQFAEAAGRLGGLDALINNAGTLGPSPMPALADYPADALADVLRTNVAAQLGVFQSVAGTFRPDAAVINVTSDAAANAYPGWGGYGASKAGLEHLSAVLGEEHPELRVYAVDPGDMRTDMHQRAFPGQDISDRPEPGEVVPGFLALLRGERPSGRYVACDLL